MEQRIILNTTTPDHRCPTQETRPLFSWRLARGADTLRSIATYSLKAVALNSGRWLEGTDSWPGPLDDFRRYAVNHEVGHAIGHGHVSCTGAGQPAPVMMQQSKGLEGCLPNGWPFP